MFMMMMIFIKVDPNHVVQGSHHYLAVVKTEQNVDFLDMWGVLDLLYARPLHLNPLHFVTIIILWRVQIMQLFITSFPSALSSFCSYIQSLISTLFPSVLSIAFFLRILEFKV